MEVMGLMLGEFVDEYTVRVIDVFAMPQSGAYYILIYCWSTDIKVVRFFCLYAKISSFEVIPNFRKALYDFAPRMALDSY